jgi:hypothetical protein
LTNSHAGVNSAAMPLPNQSQVIEYVCTLQVSWIRLTRRVAGKALVVAVCLRQNVSENIGSDRESTRNW